MSTPAQLTRLSATKVNESDPASLRFAQASDDLTHVLSRERESVCVCVCYTGGCRGEMKGTDFIKFFTLSCCVMLCLVGCLVFTVSFVFFLFRPIYFPILFAPKGKYTNIYTSLHLVGHCQISQ